MSTFEELAKRLEKQKDRDSHEGVPILSLDPGYTTGWAKFFGYELIDAGEIDTADMTLATQSIGKLIKDFKPHTIIVEDYRVYKWRAKHHAGSELLTTRVIGCIETLAVLDAIPLVKQPAHIAKGFCTNVKLKEWDFYHFGGKHARDAMRHACYFILFGQIKGKGRRSGTTVG